MIDDLKPFPTAKDSGVNWLGNVPSHWQVRRLKTLCSRSAAYGANISASSYTTSGVRFIRTSDITEEGELTSDGVFLPEKLVDDYILTDGDLLVSRSGTIGRSFLYYHRAHGVCAYAGYLVRFSPGPSTVPRFLFLYTKTPAFAGFLKVMAISSTIENVNGEKYANCPFPLPPLPEQTAIARFLDHMDRRIEKYISAKEKLIALLDEYKQVLIHQAVTGQFDVRTGEPYPEYKESGEQWLGRVPRHWGVLHLGRITLDRCDGPFGSGLKSSHYTPDGIRVVRLQNIGHSEFNGGDVAYIAPEHYATLGDHSVEPGDVLIAGLGDEHHPAGRACIAPKTIVPAMVKADCFRFRLEKKIAHPEFIALHLTATATAATATLSTGATRQRINLQSTSSRRILLPPLSEQLQIVEHTSRQTSSVQIAEQLTQQEISFLRDYRSRLIADVATGKLDVREVAANLPDIDPPASDDQTDELLDASNARAFDQENHLAGVAG